MTETYCLDCVEVALETDVAPDRAPETCTIARNDCYTILEDIDRKFFLVSGNLSLERRIVVNFARLDIELANLVAFKVNKNC